MLDLHGDLRSGSTRKVLWALHELEAPFELRHIALAKAEHRNGDYLKLNPNGKVPTLVDDGFVLWESDAILWWLAKTRGGLLPAGERDRARVGQWMSWNANHLAACSYAARVMRMTALRTAAPLDRERHAAIVQSAGPTLAILDAHLANRAFVVADDFSIADLALAMNVTFGLEEGMQIDGHNHLQAWFAALVARTAYRKANPAA